MNKKFFIGIVSLVTITSSLHAKLGCMDDSYYLTKPYDNKELHYISCNCPCSQNKIFNRQGKCIECSHYHMPIAWTVIQNNNSSFQVLQQRTVANSQQETIAPETALVIKQMIKQYKNKQKHSSIQ